MTEGYNSQWGWLNRTNVSGTPEQDADSVSKWVETQSKSTSDNPAWIDYANYKDFVPDSVKQAGNADFQSMSVGSIGRVIISGTAAATWEVYYPDGLKAEYNGVQNYGAPINKIIDMIESWGGVIVDNGGGTNPDPEEPVDPDPEIPVDPEEPIDDDNKSKEKLDKIFNLLMYKKSGLLISNKFFKVNKVYSNVYKLEPTSHFYEIVKIEDVGDLPDPEIPVDPEEPEEPTPTGDIYFPVRIQSGINFWKRDNWAVGTLQREMTYGDRAGGLHSGYDIGSQGQKVAIYATQDGTVEWSGYKSGGIGNCIYIKHDDGVYWSNYMHLDSMSVSVGDKVKAGQQIGIMGNSGGDYAIHLHFELSPDGNFHSGGNTIDPESYLQVTGDNKTNLRIPVDGIGGQGGWKMEQLRF